MCPLYKEVDLWTFEAYAHDLEVWSKIPQEVWLHSLKNEMVDKKLFWQIIIFSFFLFSFLSISNVPLLLSLTRRCDLIECT